MILCVTSEFDESLVSSEQKLEVEVQLADNQVLYLRNASFMYRPDPVITKVEPRRTILR